MGIKYLLDTNILSELSKDKPDINVAKCVEQFGDQCVTAALVMHEINYGVLRLPESKLKKNLQIFMKQLKVYKFQVLPYDNMAAHLHATERARLSSRGLTPAFVDGQIAAIASINNLSLVTRNTKDFKNYDNLPIENWFSN
jgi:tRNA(fMet)-specific endonuclease VapC